MTPLHRLQNVEFYPKFDLHKSLFDWNRDMTWRIKKKLLAWKRLSSMNIMKKIQKTLQNTVLYFCWSTSWIKKLLIQIRSLVKKFHSGGIILIVFHKCGHSNNIIFDLTLSESLPDICLKICHFDATENQAKARFNWQNKSAMQQVVFLHF